METKTLLINSLYNLTPFIYWSHYFQWEFFIPFSSWMSYNVTRSTTLLPKAYVQLLIMYDWSKKRVKPSFVSQQNLLHFLRLFIYLISIKEKPSRFWSYITCFTFSTFMCQAFTWMGVSLGSIHLMLTNLFSLFIKKKIWLKMNVVVNYFLFTLDENRDDVIWFDPLGEGGH